VQVADLIELSAAEAAAAIRERRVTATTLLDAVIGRIVQVEPRVQAWETLDLDNARAQARAVDEDLTAGRVGGPLAGVPVGVKDIYYTKGLVTRGGSAIYQDFLPSYDATAVKKLRAAGAIILGKTATTQFASGDPPPTRNPFNLEHTPGGSSSGSGAAVGARMVPGALGTQTGGSILRPAAFCGVVGLKPTYGRIGRRGVFALSWGLDHTGVLTRTVSDAALLLAAIAGPDPDDGSASDAPLDDYVGAVADPRPPRIGFIRGAFQQRADPDAWTRLEATVDRLAAAGATVEEVKHAPDFDVNWDAHIVIMGAETASVHAQRHHEHPDTYRRLLKGSIELNQLVPAAVYLHAQRVRSHLAREALKLFDGYDVLLTASAPGGAPYGIERTGDWVMTGPWTLFGFPAITIPTGLDAKGLPLGAQLATPPWQEATLLRAARWCEQALDVHIAPPL
jgi:aspartyl-tRNA(Asn)/glutamyl-tRNA(Gln) amidotransferase subunit A